MGLSKYLLRTNVALTTNVKLVIDTNHNLYLESYSANKEISSNSFKKQQINSSAFISERIANFWKGIPANLAFQVRNDIKSDSIQNDLNNQYDDIYYSGMREVEDTRYLEEFQYNTTLKVDSNNLPKWFFIFRTDGPGNVNNNGSEFVRTEMLPNMKVVKCFDLSNSTPIGQLWQKNYISDEQLPRCPFELNLKQYEFSKWNGYDYNTGGTVSKSLFMDDYFRNQTTHFEMEKFITSGFQKNEVVSAHYSNLSFLFDDTVSDTIKTYDGTTQTQYSLDDYSFLNEYVQSGQLKVSDYSIVNVSGTNYFRSNVDFSYKKRWTINRYHGFYLNDLLQIARISPYASVKFLSDPTIEIINNEFLLGGTGGTPIDPTVAGWTSDVPVYIKIYNSFYLVEKNDSGQFFIVSDQIFNFNASNSQSIVDLLNTQELPVKISNVPSNSTLTGFNFVNLITYADGTEYHVYGKVLSATTTGYALGQDRQDSLHLIKIQESYYALRYVQYQTNQWGWIIVTDDNISCDGNQLVTLKNDFQKDTVTTQILSKNYPVVFFDIFVAQFTDIEDWDFQRDVTNYAKIEYDIDDQVPYARPFLHEIDQLDVSLNKTSYEERSYQIDTFYDGLNSSAYQRYPPSVANFTMPVSSEYSASGDLYMLDNMSDISLIWNINQSVAKWGFNGSKSNCVYPYKINNSLETSGIWNFTPNNETVVKNSQQFTHDWFYSIGAPTAHSSITDMSNVAPYESGWTFYTLNIQPPFDTGALDGTGSDILENYYKFNLSYYLNPKSVFNLFDWLINSPLRIITNSDVPFDRTQPNQNRDILINNVKRSATLAKTDSVNGPQVLFRGLCAYLEWVDLPNPNVVNLPKVTPANELEDYEFAVLFDTKETTESSNFGKAGIDIILNKKHKNCLIFIYIYAPFKSITNFSFANRDVAIQQDFVSYSYYDSVTSAWTTKQSSLNVNSLTLNRLYEILNGNMLQHPEFSAGIEYEIVDDVETWSVNQSYPSYSVSYDVTLDVSRISVQLDRFLNLKHGDWFYLSGTALPSANYQIDNVLSANAFTFIASGNWSSTILSGFSNASISLQHSVQPFRFRCTSPDVVNIDQSVNATVQDNSCPVKPDNDLKSINAILKHDRALDDLVNNVWIDNPMSRKINKKNNLTDLTPNQVQSLPHIKRFGGDYFPITNELNLFDRHTLYPINIADDGTANFALSNYYTDTYDGSVYLHIQITDTALNLMDGLKVGDLIYLRDSTIPVTKTDFHTQLVEVLSIKSKTLVGSVYKYVIVTNMSFLTNSYPNMVSPRTGLDGLFFYKVESNTSLKFDNRSFGLNKGIVVAKQYITSKSSPLKTSSPIYNVNNKWAMIDEHGVTSADRNIFQSSWDLNFYLETNKNSYNS